MCRERYTEVMGGKSHEPEPLRLPLLSDHAISNSDLEADHFRLEKKLGAVVDAIRLKDTATPFSIMLTGGWGAGKTSAMSWLDATFKSEKQVNSSPNYCNVDTCWFYPWKYQNKEDVWRGLIAEVILRAMRVEGVDSAKILKAARQFGGFLGRGFIRLLGSANVKVGNSKATGFESDIDLKEAISGVMEEYGKHVTPQEAYFNEFENIFKGWVEDTYPSHGNRRLVVFIDDLDRCMPDIALQVLEALKLYLQVPNLVFVVGVERSVIDRIVHKRYSDLVGAEVMADGFHEKAARYLDKMFTVEVNIEPTDEEVSEFFARRVESTKVWEAVPAEHRDRLKRVILNLSGRTPRSIVRLVNRVVIACGRRSPESSLNLAQELQRELIDAACQQLGYDDLPQRNAEGRIFFSIWSRILSKRSKGQAVRFPPAELKLRLEMLTFRIDQKTSEIEQSWPDRFLNPEFDHLAPLLKLQFRQYAKLLTSLDIAILLEIPYSETLPDISQPLTPEYLALSSVSWNRLYEIVSNANGMDPLDVTTSYLEQLTELTLEDEDIDNLSLLAFIPSLKNLTLRNTSGTNITFLDSLQNLQTLSLLYSDVKDLSPVRHLKHLRYLAVYDSPASDFSFVSELEQLEFLGLYYVGVRDLSPLAHLRNLRRLDIAGTNVSDLSPLRSIKSLESITLLDVPVSDFSPLIGLDNLTQVILPDGTFWNPQSEPIPDKYNPKAR